MTAFFALVRKDLILFLSDRRALLVSLVLPIVIAAFFGYIFSGTSSKGSAIEIALVQQDTSESARKIAEGLKADSTLKVKPMALAAAERTVRKGELKVAVVIPAGFGEAAGSALFGAGEKPEIGLLYDPSQPAVLAMVKGLLTQHVMQVVSAEMFGGQQGLRFTERGLRELAESGRTDPPTVALRNLLGSVLAFQSLPQPAPGAAPQVPGGLSMPFTTRDRQLSSASLERGYDGYAHSFAGMGVQFILFLGIDTGIGILLARRSGVWSRLLAAPVTLTGVLLARVVSATVIAFSLLVVIFGVGVAAFGVHVASVGGFVGVALAFSLMTAGFGLFIAAFGKTPEAARGIAVFATLMMVMLGGAWMPSFLFPEWMQRLTLVIPTRWAIDGFDAVTWRGLGMEAALPAMAVQLLFAAAFGGLAIWRFSREQD